MFTKKFIAFPLIILIFMVSIGAIQASDDITQMADDSKAQIGEEKSFDDIKTALDKANPNDVVELEGTYSSNGNGITVDKDLTIQGNAILDGKSQSRMFSTNKDVKFKDLTFINGANKNLGSAIYSNNQNNKLTFINCTFINNQAKSEPNYSLITGGAIYAKGDLTIINCTFKDNSGDSCSAVSCGGNKLTIKNSDFINNQGGCTIFALAESFIEKSNFINNSDVIESVVSIDVKECNFTDNQISIICEYGATVTNCIFLKNKMGIEKIYNTNEVTIKNSNFKENVNAVSINSDCLIDGSTFINNANYAVKLSSWTDEPFYVMPSNDATIQNSLFESNHGAISNSYNKLKVVSCKFKDNSADYGSAIHNEGGAVTIESSELSNNAPASIVCVDLEDYSGCEYTGSVNINNVKYSHVNLDDSLKKIELVKLTASKVSTVYYSGDRLTVELVNINTGKAVKGAIIELKVFTGKKYKIYKRSTNSRGVAAFKASAVNVGSHKVEISAIYPCNSKKIVTVIKVAKAGTIVKAPKVTFKKQKSKYFKVAVKHKTTKKAVKNTIVKLKVDKKIYKIKTNSKGIAKFNTKNLKVGKHRVIITSGTANYKISAKSTITIKR